VHIDPYPVGDDTVLITRGERDYFSLLVIPPDTTPDAARSAMARAVRADNATAEQLSPAFPPAEVARRAGHSIAVLFRFYAKAIHRSQQRANEQIQRALEAADV
jgi:hypothetical protein